MFSVRVLATLLSLLAVAWAGTPPTYAGYTRKWQSTFIGAAGLPSTGNWNIINNVANYNNEYQTYKASANNVRLSGSGTLQLIAHGDSSAPRGWTSGRMESKYTFTPTAGKITWLEAKIRVGGAPASQKQGIWPAFWLMGDAYRQGVLWPASGEIDIFESINGNGVAHGVLHCGTNPGGVCNEPIGLADTAAVDNAYHVWKAVINRQNSNYASQTISWYKDGVLFHRVKGSQIGSAVWASLTAKPLYIIANLAVGGDFPGPPNSKSVGGTGTMLEINYIAHYESN